MLPTFADANDNDEPTVVAPSAAVPTREETDAKRARKSTATKGGLRALTAVAGPVRPATLDTKPGPVGAVRSIPNENEPAATKSAPPLPLRKLTASWVPKAKPPESPDAELCLTTDIGSIAAKVVLFDKARLEAAARAEAEASRLAIPAATETSEAELAGLADRMFPATLQVRIFRYVLSAMLFVVYVIAAAARGTFRGVLRITAAAVLAARALLSAVAEQLRIEWQRAAARARRV